MRSSSSPVSGRVGVHAVEPSGNDGHRGGAGDPRRQPGVVDDDRCRRRGAGGRRWARAWVRTLARVGVPPAVTMSRMQAVTWACSRVKLGATPELDQAGGGEGLGGGDAVQQSLRVVGHAAGRRRARSRWAGGARAGGRRRRASAAPPTAARRPRAIDVGVRV